MTGRLERLRAELESRQLDALLVSTPENRRYLSGFTGSAGHLFVTAERAVLATDFRYTEQAAQQAPGWEVLRIGADLSWFTDLVAAAGARRVGFEAQHLTVWAYSQLKRALEEKGLEARLVATTGLVEGLRAVKEPGELELIARASQIADEAFEEVAPTIAPGMTEEQVAWELEMAMRRRGAEAVSFDIIVAAGPNGALPHHRADGTVIREGDAVVIDMGARYQGYCSDLTRTIVVGRPDETFGRVYETVLRAQEEAEARVRAGMTGAEADAIARQVIAQAGYGDRFGHSLGHGVGLAVHERPVVGPRGQDRLEDGMVFTVEPGIYLPGWGGVRIEDMVVMEGGRVRVLSRAHKRPTARG